MSDELLNLAKMGFSGDDIERIVENGLAERPAPWRASPATQ